MFEVQQLNAMQQPSWNEGRLDDLNRKVDKGIGRLDDERKELRGELRAGFENVGKEFKSVRAEMKAGFDKVDEEFKSVRAEMKTDFDRVNERFDRIDERFDQLTRFLLGGALAIVVALIGAPHI